MRVIEKFEFVEVIDMDFKTVQKIAKDIIEYARKTIKAGMTLFEVRELCEKKLLELGADSFWYWDIGAFVFSGNETKVSVSGIQYKTSDRVIGVKDIITIDLSPQNADIWGDYARTIVIEEGVVVDDNDCSNEEWKNGIVFEKELHREMQKFITPNTTFEPHISIVGSDYGYKWENIYYFENDKLVEL